MGLGRRVTVCGGSRLHPPGRVDGGGAGAPAQHRPPAPPVPSAGEACDERLCHVHSRGQVTCSGPAPFKDQWVCVRAAGGPGSLGPCKPGRPSSGCPACAGSSGRREGLQAVRTQRRVTPPRPRFLLWRLRVGPGRCRGTRLPGFGVVRAGNRCPVLPRRSPPQPHPARPAPLARSGRAHPGTRHTAVPRPPGVSECSRPDEAVGPHVVVSLVPQTTREPSLARGPAIPTSSPGAGPS